MSSGGTVWRSLARVLDPDGLGSASKTCHRHDHQILLAKFLPTRRVCELRQSRSSEPTSAAVASRCCLPIEATADASEG